MIQGQEQSRRKRWMGAAQGGMISIFYSPLTYRVQHHRGVARLHANLQHLAIFGATQHLLSGPAHAADRNVCGAATGTRTRRRA